MVCMLTGLPIKVYVTFLPDTTEAKHGSNMGLVDGIIDCACPEIESFLHDYDTGQKKETARSFRLMKATISLFDRKKTLH